MMDFLLAPSFQEGSGSVTATVSVWGVSVLGCGCLQLKVNAGNAKNSSATVGVLCFIILLFEPFSF
jgi:hypothetical protein